MKNLFYVLALSLFVLTGCDNKDLLQSEDKIREQIENKSWKRIAATPTLDYHEIWAFKEGKLTISVGDSTTAKDTTFNGTYTVDTKVSSSYVSFLGFPSVHQLIGLDFTNLNIRWTIAEINDNVLYLSATNESGTIKSLEFVVQ